MRKVLSMNNNEMKQDHGSEDHRYDEQHRPDAHKGDTAAVQEPPKAHPYEVDVANESFESRPLRIEPYQATGQGLIEALGYKPTDAYIALRYRPDGSLEEIGLE